MKVKVTNDNVLLKLTVPETKTKAGIILTESQNKKNIAEIIDINENYELKIGSKVIFDEYATKKIKLENEDFLICKFSDILAVLED